MWNKLLKWVAITVAAIVALLAVGLFVLHIHCNRLIDKELARIHAEGYPVTLEELNAFYPTPTGQNAADVYARAFGLLQKEYPANMPVAGKGELPPLGEPLPEEMKTMISQYVEQNAPAISALRDATTIRDCRYPVDFKDGFETKLPHLGKIRNSARLLELAAIYNAGAGRHAESAENVVAGFACARSLNAEPITISLLVGISIYESSLKGLSYSMSLTQFDETDLQNVADSLHDEPPSNSLSRAFIGERCMFIKSWDQRYVAGLLGRPLGMFYSLTGMCQLDKIFYSKTIRRWAEIAALPLPEQLTAAATHVAEISPSITGSWSDVFHLKGFPIHPIGSLMQPALKLTFGTNASCIARMRCAQTAIAIEQFRLNKHALPTELYELVPEYLPAIPVDPFNGKPVLYKKLDKGYVVYSVGENKVDDGGIDRKPGDKYGEILDVIFQVIR